MFKIIKKSNLLKNSKNFEYLMKQEIFERIKNDFDELNENIQK